MFHVTHIASGAVSSTGPMTLMVAASEARRLQATTGQGFHVVDSNGKKVG